MLRAVHQNMERAQSEQEQSRIRSNRRRKAEKAERRIAQQLNLAENDCVIGRRPVVRDDRQSLQVSQIIHQGDQRVHARLEVDRQFDLPTLGNRLSRCPQTRGIDPVPSDAVVLCNQFAARSRNCADAV